MPTKRIFALGVMIFVGGSLALGGAHVWAARVLSETDGKGPVGRFAELVALI